MKQFDQENVWKIVKETRKSFLSQHKNPECLDDGTLLSDNSIKDNIDTVEKKLKLSPIYSPNKKVSGNTLEDAVNVYTYLNYCPPELLHYVKDLITTGSPKDIILGLTGAKRMLQNQKQSISKLFIKIMENLNLKDYETIQIITKGKCYNKDAIFGNCGKKFNTSNKEISGIYYTYIFDIILILR